MIPPSAYALLLAAAETRRAENLRELERREREGDTPQVLYERPVENRARRRAREAAARRGARRES